MINRFIVGSAVLGGALLVTGAALIFHPLGYIVAGVELLSIALLHPANRRKAQ